MKNVINARIKQFITLINPLSKITSSLELFPQLNVVNVAT